MQLKLGTQCGREIKPRILTSVELFMICSDSGWDLKHQLEKTKEDTTEETEGDKTGWQKLAFFKAAATDHKVLHKIGLEIENGVQVYLGEFAIFTRRMI